MSIQPTTRRLLPESMKVSYMSADTGALTVHTESMDDCVRCPGCGQRTERAHSRYQRTVADLPWRGIAVKIQILARRFFCDETSCERRIFCERLPEIESHARKTGRLEEALLAIVLELGGRAGARLAAELGLLVGRDALLERIRGNYRSAAGEVKVLGVDDFAFRKASKYGTILVDLERHEVVDLLPDRSSKTLAEWLRQNPNLETVSRDRSPTYAEGIATGAPQATQVADRWHLMRNLAETLDEFLVGKRPLLKMAAGSEAKAEGDETTAAEVAANHTYEDPSAPGPLTPNRPRPGYASLQQSKRKRYRLLVERWKEIRRLQEAGADVADIARKLGVSRPTVYRYKDLLEPPEFGQHRRRQILLDPYIPYILKRWDEGCRNGRKLFREIREQGYSYSESNVGRLVAELRRSDGLTGVSKKRRTANSSTAQAPGTRHVATLFLRRPEKLTDEQAAYLGRLRASDEAVSSAYELAQRFASMVRNLDGERLEKWLTEAESCKIQALGNFAASLKKDLDAVRAGLTERWNNGPVEGFVHKLKLIKRQGYGRANFDLLRARVLAA